MLALFLDIILLSFRGFGPSKQGRSPAVFAGSTPSRSPNETLQAATGEEYQLSPQRGAMNITSGVQIKKAGHPPMNGNPEVIAYSLGKELRDLLTRLQKQNRAQQEHQGLYTPIPLKTWQLKLPH